MIIFTFQSRLAMLKKMLSVLVVFMFFSKTYSQIYFSAGPLVSFPVEYPSYERFAVNYNRYFKNELSDSLAMFSGGFGFIAEGGIRITKAIVFIEAFHYTSQPVNAVFTSGHQRTFILSESRINLNAGIGRSLKFVSVYAYGGLLFGTISMRSFYSLHNQLPSAGLETILNGKYTAFQFGACWGVKAFVNLSKKISLNITLNRGGDLRKSKPPLTDKNTGKKSSPSSFQYIAIEYEKTPALFSSGVIYDDGRTVTGDFKSYNLYLGIVINIK